jgi:hypothetical protein
MIDGIQITTYHFDVDKLVTDEALDFAPLIAPLSMGGLVVGYTTKLRSELFAKIKLQFEHKGKFYPYPNPKLEIKGSLHKFKDGQNDTDFNFIDVCSTIGELCDLLSLEPLKCEVHFLEFGVNIPLSMRPKKVFDNYVSFQQKRFVHNGDTHAKAEFEGVKCSLSHFEIKVYDKGKQYGLKEPLMRFECKVMKMQYLKNKKVLIQTLEDLKNKEIYYGLGKILKSIHESILKVNQCDISAMKTSEGVLFKEGRFFDYWKELGKNINANNTEKVRFKRTKHKFKAINEKYKTDDRHKQTGVLIERKCKELIEKSVPNITTSKNVIEAKNVLKFTDSKPMSKKENVPNITLCIKVTLGTFNPLHMYF